MILPPGLDPAWLARMAKLAQDHAKEFDALTLDLTKRSAQFSSVLVPAELDRMAKQLCEGNAKILQAVGAELARSGVLFSSAIVGAAGDELIKAAGANTERIQAFALEVAESHARFLRGMNQHFAQMAQFATWLPAFIDVIERLPSSRRSAILLLAERGWYPSPDIPMGVQEKALASFANGDRAEGNRLLTEYYSSTIDEHADSLMVKHPDRGHLLDQAIAAHRRGHYAVAIPVLLAQADGVTKKRLKVSLYDKTSDQTPKTAKKVPEQPDRVLDDLLLLLRVALPIRQSKPQREAGTGLLYRHAVLHGESTDYDTEENSCRALSLVTYVTWMLEELDRVEAENEEE